MADNPFIFTGNGIFIHPEYFTRWIALRLIWKATEGRVKRFHNLRHFFASTVIEGGENPNYIQVEVGHTTITTACDTNGHLMPRTKRKAAGKLERSIFGGKQVLEQGVQAFGPKRRFSNS